MVYMVGSRQCKLYFAMYVCHVCMSRMYVMYVCHVCMW